MTETPEFQDAVKRAVETALANALPSIVANQPRGQGSSLERLTEQLALSIGELTNQNSGQKLVSPEVLAHRREAERQMHERIARAVAAVAHARERNDQALIDKETPHYRLTAKIFAPLMSGDELIEPVRRGADNLVHPTELDWLLPPNLAMVPMNGAAKEIFALFKESIGNQATVRLSGISGRGSDAEPVFAAADHDEYFLTNQGHVIQGAPNSSVALRNSLSPTLGAPAANDSPLDRGVARIRGQEAARQHSGPPTVQVRILGTVAPPAVQNG